MIVLHNKEIFFSLSFVNSVLDLHLSLEDCIINDEFVIPFNSLFFHHYKQPNKLISNDLLTVNTEKLGLIINKEERVFLLLREKENIFKIEIPNTSSFCFDDLTKSSSNIFNTNILNYRSNNTTVDNIVFDIYSKTVFQSRNNNSYISTIKNLSKLDVSFIDIYQMPRSSIIEHTLNNIECIYKEN